MLRLIRQRGDRDGRLTSKRLRTVRATSHSTVRRCRCEESGRRRSKDAPRHRAYWYMRDGEQPEILRRYFVAHVAQISRGNAQANAVNSTDLAWSRLVRDQEDGGSNPLAPTNSFGTDNLHTRKSGRPPGAVTGARLRTEPPDCPSHNRSREGKS
jgi:hypothetical protein